MASEKYMRLDPAYRKLQKLKDLVRKENVSSKIGDEIDEVLDLMKVSEKLYSYIMLIAWTKRIVNLKSFKTT